MATLSLTGACARVDVASDAETAAYVNGRWYDGAAFAWRTVYVREGVFVEKPVSGAAREIDLAGGYVVPAFAEAHHHTVLCDPDRIAQFVQAGVLYAAIMNARVSSRECQSRLHGDRSVEIVSALAGLTATNAHPSQIGLYFLAPEEVDGEWVHAVDNAADLDRVWSRIEADRPDFLKIFLSYSEDFDRLKSDPAIEPWYRGLDPALAAPIVSRAHASGLKVAAHVMSAHDFDVAVDAGVDIIAHTPGAFPGAAFTDEPEHSYFSKLAPDAERYRISRESASRASARGVAVVTTLSGRSSPGEAAAANIAALRGAGVPLLIGSDRGEGDPIDEAIFLVENGLMPAREALNSLSITTPRYFFSDRRIGEFAAGAEATFVVLRGDPIADIRNLRTIASVTQRGDELYHAAKPGAAAGD